jgi:hypothetical protein
MIPWILLVVTILFYLTTGWLPYVLYVPVTLGMLAASLVAAWALLVRRRPHARLGFPMLAVPTALLLFGPVDVSVSPRAPLGVRAVPVVYGLLTDRGPVDRGEIDSRGCLVPPNPKLWTVQIGLRLPSFEEWGRGTQRLERVEYVEEVTAMARP